MILQTIFSLTLFSSSSNLFCEKQSMAAISIPRTACSKRKVDRLFFDVTVLAPDPDFFKLAKFMSKIVSLEALSHSRSFAKLPDVARNMIEDFGLMKLKTVRINYQSNFDDAFILGFEKNVELHVSLSNKKFRWGHSIPSY